MRVLFVCGVRDGGAPRSTLELASELNDAGHAAVVLMPSASPPSVYELATKAVIKSAGSPWKQSLQRPVRRFGAKLNRSQRPGVWVSKAPENAVMAAAAEFRPDAIIANSFPRAQMEWISSDAATIGVPFGVYAREAHAVTHFTITGLNPELVIANSRELAELSRQAGRSAHYVPSLIDLKNARVESTRKTVVLVNAISEYRPHILVALANLRPDIPCAWQESWPLSTEQRTTLLSWTEQFANLTFRPLVPRPSTVFQDARIILAPYPSGRPRTVAEAQSNGIPVIGLNQPSMAEAIGGGGLLIPPDASDEEWAATIAQLWDDRAEYERLAVQARAHASRDELNREWVVSEFICAVQEVIGR